jgi:O-antigen ligase
VLLELQILLTGRRHAISMRRIGGPAILFAATLAWISIQISTLVPASLAHPIWSMARNLLELPVDGSISVDRAATSIAFIRLATGASVFWLALQLSHNATRAHLLLRGIGVIIAAYATYGLVLAAFFSNANPFFDAPDMGPFIRSSFVNRNNFATYAGLGLVTTIALILRMFGDEVPCETASLSYRMSKFVETTGRRGWLLLGCGFVILVGLLGSVSRGGVLATSLGAICLLVLTFLRQRRRRSARIEAIVFVTAALATTVFFFGDLIVGRLAVAGLEDDDRFAVYTIVLRAILDTPLLGFGYGAFADVFPMYRDQSIAIAGTWDMAHDTYLEVWLGLGLVFGSALIASLGWLVLKCFVGALERRQNATPAIVASACSLLVGVHALVDFSLQIEGVALTYMAILGIGVAQSESSRASASD